MHEKIVKDPIHGYIKIEEDFIGVVDSAEFQRLRNIEQGSFRVLYPAARHDRFIHSLGTYHLSCIVSEKLIENIRCEINVSNDTIEKLKKTFRYAALMHDVGHAPFSHTTENFFKIGCNLRELLLEKISNCNYNEGFDKRDWFKKDFTDCDPAAHEMVSAVLLIELSHKLLRNYESVDISLASRMIVGNTFDYRNISESSNHDVYGLANCLIRLLNSNTVDIDKLDYITRDTRMSGFYNVPIDIQRITSSVSAIRRNNDLYPAYNKNALSVIDNVFRAKSEQGAWIVSPPVVTYDSALLSACIKLTYKSEAIGNVFSVKSLSLDGNKVDGRMYRLLSDIEVANDIRQNIDKDSLVDEYYNRSKRRKPFWKSYYEFKFLFENENDNITTTRVYEYFTPLIQYMESKNYFVLDLETVKNIESDKDVRGSVRQIVFMLKEYCDKIQKELDFVLLGVKTSFYPRFDPDTLYIRFDNLPPKDEKKYTSYGKLKNSSGKEDKKFFYLYYKGAISPKMVFLLREMIWSKLIHKKP